MSQHKPSAFVLALTLLPLAARAQEPEKQGTIKPETTQPEPAKPDAKKPVAPTPKPSPLQPPQDDAQREMVELFGKVERQLHAIDRLLQEASRAPGAGGSIAEQLRTAQASGASVQKDIDRILEIAASQRPQSGSSGGESKPGEGENPMNRQGEQSTGRETTPSMPQQGGEKPEPGGEQKKPGGQDDKPGGTPKKPDEQGREKGDGPQASKADPQQKPGSDPSRGAQGSGTPANDARDRWGDLPMHAREVFRNEGGRDMPPLYREWIDAYYKRLNKKP